MDLRRLLYDKRNVPPGAGGLMSAGWLAEQFAAGEQWFSAIPFGWLAIVSFAFWLGYDLYHSEGRIRERWRVFRSAGTFDKMRHRYVQHKVYVDPTKSVGHLAIIIPFTFRRNVKIDIVRITVHRHMAPGRIIQRPYGVYVWRTHKDEKYLRGDTIEIPLAYVLPDEYVKGYYGDLEDAGACLVEGSAHVFAIEIFAGRYQQKTRYLLLLPSSMASYSMDREMYLGGKLMVVQEGESLFPELRE